jgi:hypothetical protein
MRRRLAQPLWLGHIDSVLQDVGDAALFIEDGGMGRAPEAILDFPVAILGPGYSIPDERDDVRFPGRSDKPQLPVEDHVGIRRVFKESPEVDRGRHALGSSLPVARYQFPVTSEDHEP